MTPKEKAQEMVDRFIQGTRNRYEKDSLSYRRAKQCALIAVDEILKAIRKDSDFTITYEKAKEYYQQVKQEIELL